MATNVYLIYINCIIVLRDLYVYTMVLMFDCCTKMNYTMMSQLLRHYYMSHLCRGITCKCSREFGCAI